MDTTCLSAASWMVYRFLAPTSWREWTGAGLLQAFIIALYAEMYGFPLTIYFLTAVLGIDLPNAHWSGHLWATLLGYGPDGGLVEMAIGMGFLVAGLLLIIKGWVRIYFSDRRFYALVRHPQYAGIFLVIVGQLIHWPTMLTLFSPLRSCWFMLTSPTGRKSGLSRGSATNTETISHKSQCLFRVGATYAPRSKPCDPDVTRRPWRRPRSCAKFEG